MHPRSPLMKPLLTLVLSLCCTASPCAAGGDPVSLEVVSAWGGPVNAVQIVGNMAFAGAGRRLVALDISDPAQVTEIGSIVLGETVRDVAVQGNYAYVTMITPKALTIVDVSDPSSMSIAWQALQPAVPFNISCDEVDLRGNIAYVRDLGRLRAYDISTPANSQYLGQVTTTGAVVRESTIVGDRLYVATRELASGPAGETGGGLRIYDLSSGTPLNPPLVGWVMLVPQTIESIDVFGYGLAVEGGHAYVTTRGAVFGYRVFIIDVSTPASPSVAGICTGFNEAMDLAVSGGYLYVADWTGGAYPFSWEAAKGLVVIDVSNPGQPVQAATLKTHGTVKGVRIAGNRAYLSDDGEGLIVVDISNPPNPVRLGNYHSPAQLRQTTKVGDLLYVTDMWNGFTILDVSNPLETPAVVGVYQTPSGIGGLGINNWAVAVQGDYAYLTAGWYGLQVVDVSDPTNPAFVSGAPNPPEYRARGLAMTGSVAHVGLESDNSVWIYRNYDVGNPRSVGLLASLSLAWGGPAALNIAVNPQGIAFIGRNGKPQRINTGAQGEPPFQAPMYLSSGVGDSLPGVVDLNNYAAVDSALNGDHLYIVNRKMVPDQGGIYVRNVSDPLKPVDENYVPLGVPSTIAVQNDRLYVMTGGVLNLLDVARDPTVPTAIAPLLHMGGGTLWDLLVGEPFVYATSSGSNFDSDTNSGTQDVGVVIVQVNGLPQECPADIDNSGSVDVDDLVAVILGWGPCGKSCTADIDDSGEVDVDDLVAVILAWGPCP